MARVSSSSSLDVDEIDQTLARVESRTRVQRRRAGARRVVVREQRREKTSTAVGESREGSRAGDDERESSGRALRATRSLVRADDVEETRGDDARGDEIGDARGDASPSRRALENADGAQDVANDDASGDVQERRGTRRRR